MKTQRDPGPFLRSEFIPDKRIEESAIAELQATGLMPGKPGPVNVELFCDVKWGKPEDYRKLEPGVLGCAMFTYNGLAEIVISADLLEDTTITGHRRVRSTLAHEIGHGVTHEPLFIERLRHDMEQPLLFGEVERKISGVVCRESDIFGTPSPWWEIQANRFMAAMLMPRPLFLEVVRPAMKGFVPEERKTFKMALMLGSAADTISETFNVSGQMARIAIEGYLKREGKTDREEVLL